MRNITMTRALTALALLNSNDDAALRKAAREAAKWQLAAYAKGDVVPVDNAAFDKPEGWCSCGWHPHWDVDVDGKLVAALDPAIASFMTRSDVAPRRLSDGTILHCVVTAPAAQLREVA